MCVREVCSKIWAGVWECKGERKKEGSEVPLALPAGNEGPNCGEADVKNIVFLGCPPIGLPALWRDVYYGHLMC
jgi:hypothetical protein